jgi:hypothetical protein
VYNSRRERTPRLELFAESFRALADGRVSVGRAWRTHADDEKFEEA